jgi:hypothetical protein
MKGHERGKIKRGKINKNKNFEVQALVEFNFPRSCKTLEYKLENQNTKDHIT